MRMPQHPARWVMTILFVALVGLTWWIVWALDKIEAKRAVKKATPDAVPVKIPARSAEPTPAPAVPPAPPDRKL